MEYPSLTMGLPLEDLNVTPEERAENIAEQLKQSAESKRALIVKVSHIGGHKYAGNCIVSVRSPQPQRMPVMAGVQRSVHRRRYYF